MNEKVINVTHIANPVRVNAATILDVTETGADTLMLRLSDGRNYEADTSMTVRYCPVPGDYLVTQDDGYEYLNPKDVFERKYAQISADGIGAGLNFGDALHQMKIGDRIARAGWNGKGMWVALGGAHPGLEAAKFWSPHARAHAEANGGQCPVQAYILMKTAQGDIQMGWSPTQSDVLANDWLIVD